MMMAFTDLGIEFSKREIARISNYKLEDGLTKSQLISTLRKFGATVHAQNNSSWTDLYRCNNADTVGIVAWVLKGYIWHFSIVDHVDKTSVTIVDPYYGKHKTYDRKIFMRLWWTCDDLWYPEKNTDIELRWLCLVKKKSGKQ